MTSLEIVLKSNTSKGPTMRKINNMIKLGELERIKLTIPYTQQQVTFYRLKKD